MTYLILSDFMDRFKHIKTIGLQLMVSFVAILLLITVYQHGVRTNHDVYNNVSHSGHLRDVHIIMNALEDASVRLDLEKLLNKTTVVQQYQVANGEQNVVYTILLDDYRNRSVFLDVIHTWLERYEEEPIIEIHYTLEATAIIRDIWSVYDLVTLIIAIGILCVIVIECHYFLGLLRPKLMLYQALGYTPIQLLKIWSVGWFALVISAFCMAYVLYGGILRIGLLFIGDTIGFGWIIAFILVYTLSVGILLFIYRVYQTVNLR